MISVSAYGVPKMDSHKVQIGNYDNAGPSRPFNGSIDSVMIINLSLSLKNFPTDPQ